MLSRFVHGLIVRTYAHSRPGASWPSTAAVPVINALTDFLHPCQIYADAFTAAERWAGPQGDLLAALRGPQDRVPRRHALQHGQLVDPRRESLRHEDLARRARRATSRARRSAPSVAEDWAAAFQFTTDPYEAVAGADIVYTDVWTSMGQEEESRRRARAACMPYQVNGKAFRRGEAGCAFHALPAGARRARK